MNRKKIDVLIIARPDHSYKIYQALSAQKELSFLYVSFGLFPRWLSFLRLPKLRYVDGNALILKWFTVLHTLHFKLHWTKSFDEKKCFERSLRRVLHRYEPRIIHYWPDYCHSVVDEYKQSHPDVITIAEMYMPNPVSVIDDMKAVYQKHGLEFRNDFLETYAQQIGTRFNCADYVMVASKYVEDTMKLTYPDKKYIAIPYGIQKSPGYQSVRKEGPVRKFVYSGVVSLEKGVDVICEYYSQHPEYELHLFGRKLEAQSAVFDKYHGCRNIIFHGPVSRDELYEAFTSMDVGIHPSRFDAYSLAVCEEIGSGLPVLVSEHTGNKDDILKYGWGYTFSDAKSLSEMIEQISVKENHNRLRSSIDSHLEGNHQTYTETLLRLYSNISI